MGSVTTVSLFSEWVPQFVDLSRIDPIFAADTGGGPDLGLRVGHDGEVYSAVFQESCGLLASRGERAVHRRRFSYDLWVAGLREVEPVRRESSRLRRVYGSGRDRAAGSRMGRRGAS